MEKFKEIWKKIKSIKNYEIILCAIIIAVVLLIYFSVSESRDSIKEKSEASNETSASVMLTEGLEERLSNILEQIDGVGEVSVLITYASTEVPVIADTVNSHSTTTSGDKSQTTTTTNTSTPLISNQDVIVIQEKMPEILGVIVVASGAEEVKIKLKILTAVSTALGINGNSIQIYTRRDS